MMVTKFLQRSSINYLSCNIMATALKRINLPLKNNLLYATLKCSYSSSTTSSSSSSSDDKIKIKDISDTEIKKSVFISQSYDIFTNLALEDWLYKNFDFSNHHVLMLWSNDPCVVIGRHQNPFTETNVSNLTRKGITLARRNSGGGTVYHDRGNLNCTFFTPRERYNRKYNLNIVSRALFREWGIKADINSRDDIVINDKKIDWQAINSYMYLKLLEKTNGNLDDNNIINEYMISGTAAKLGHPNAYHHCTLLVNTNKQNLTESLIKDEAKYSTKATQSVKSSVRNICDVNRNVNVSQLISAVGYEFLRTSATQLVDGGKDQAMQQRGFQLINPTEKWFPGIMEIREMFSSWDWCFGKTPKFIVEKEINLKSDDKEHKILLKIDVEKGIMTDINLTLPTNDVVPVVSNLLNKPYSEEHFNGIIDALKLVSTENVKQAINEL